MQVRLGLPEELRAQAVELYWQAFGGKLWRVMGPDARAHAFLQRVMRADHCICAVANDGTLAGIAGFKSPEGSFAGGDAQDMRAIYGRFGAAWRGAVLRLLQNDVDNDRFLIDGICVARPLRGKGVGTDLVHALINEARRRGYRAIRLEVIDTNVRARMLYERLGFAAVDSAALGPLRHIFGFSRAVTMVRAVSTPPAHHRVQGQKATGAT